MNPDDTIDGGVTDTLWSNCATERLVDFSPLCVFKCNRYLVVELCRDIGRRLLWNASRLGGGCFGHADWLVVVTNKEEPRRNPLFSSSDDVLVTLSNPQES